MKKMEFSKLVFFLLYMPTLLLSSVTSLVAYMAGDAGAMVSLITAWVGMLTLGVVFYYWKAKAENVKKLLKQVPPESAEIARDMLDN
jgi:heme/copper-type cytochrome/quinol oxidase subunit 3